MSANDKDMGRERVREEIHIADRLTNKMNNEAWFRTELRYTRNPRSNIRYI